MAGPGNDPVQGFRTCRDLHWDFFYFFFIPPGSPGSPGLSRALRALGTVFLPRALHISYRSAGQRVKVGIGLIFLGRSFSTRLELYFQLFFEKYFGR
jgi:hypothetical protein